MSDTQSVRVDPLLLQPSSSQPYLFVEVFRDDAALIASATGEWLRALLQLDWRSIRVPAALYYTALWEFNQAAARERALRQTERPAEAETREQAVLRLVTDRPTGGNDAAPQLLPVPVPPVSPPSIRPENLEPGVVPFRLAGKPPKCFFALTKAFLGVHLMGKAASAEEVDHHLRVSPSFARACGFTLPRPGRGYRHTDTPSLRKLEQFDQIMSARGLWSSVKAIVVGENLAREIVPVEGQALTYDTTHYVAYSQLETVPAPPIARSQASAPAPQFREAHNRSTESRSRAARRGQRRRQRKARQEAHRAWLQQREEKRARRQGQRGGLPRTPAGSGAANSPSGTTVKGKSQSKTVKACRCVDWTSCPHPWVLCDPGAGTVVKGGRTGGKKKYWAHKAAVISTGPGGVPLEATAMTDAASHDSNGMLPAIERLFETYPMLQGVFRTLLADSAMDDVDLKEQIKILFGLTVKTPVNPRGIKPRTADIGRGMKSLSPTGTLTCQGERQMEFLGVRFASEQFLYGPPGGSRQTSACSSCPHRSSCCRSGNAKGRHVAIKFCWLPHIDPADPPMARRFKAIMFRRTAVERAIKRLKLDFGDDRLTRRGNEAFQGHLDRSLIALHLTLRLAS